MFSVRWNRIVGTSSQSNHIEKRSNKMSTKLNQSNVRYGNRMWNFVMAALLIAMVVSGMSIGPAYAASNQVPFNASFSGTVAFTGPTSAALSGSGISAYLGSTAYAGAVSEIVPTDTGLTDVLVETLTAANGDTITILCNQTAVQQAPGVFQGSDEWTVIGGTGRFAGASGSGTGVTYIDLNNGTFSKQLTGTISAPSGN